jgi:hypothetical protein
VLADPSRLVRLRRRRVEERVEVAGAADCGDGLADHRRVPHRGVVVDVRLEGAIGGLGPPVEGENRERPGRY